MLLCDLVLHGGYCFPAVMLRVGFESELGWVGVGVLVCVGPLWV